jgi:hypothetical protein
MRMNWCTYSSVHRKACLDTFGEHATHCSELPGFKYRHDLVKDVFLISLGVHVFL